MRGRAAVLMSVASMGVVALTGVDANAALPGCTKQIPTSEDIIPKEVSCTFEYDGVPLSISGTSKVSTGSTNISVRVKFSNGTPFHSPACDASAPLIASCADSSVNPGSAFPTRSPQIGEILTCWGSTNNNDNGGSITCESG